MPEFGKLELSLILGGIVLAGLGNQLSNSFLIGLGVFLFGVGLLIGGINVLFRRGFGFWHHNEIRVWLRGITLWMWGFIWFLGGVWALIIALVVLFGRGELAQAYIFRRPGILILSIGIAILGKGISNMFELSRAGNSTGDILRGLPRRVGGFLLFLLSISLVGLGLFEIIAPIKFDAFFSSVLSTIATRIQ